MKTMKHWVADESERCGVAVWTIYRWMNRGLYKNALSIKRENKRVLFVLRFEPDKVEPHTIRRRWTGLSGKIMGEQIYQRKYLEMKRKRNQIEKGCV